MSDDTLPRQVAIRLSEEDVRRLDALNERITIASRNAVARAALRIGLAVLENDPMKIIEAPKRGRKPRRVRT